MTLDQLARRACFLAALCHAAGFKRAARGYLADAVLLLHAQT